MGKNKSINNIAAAILAGGKNSRMSGFNKALILIDGVPIIQQTVKLLKGIFDEIILVTNSAQDFKAYDKETIITADIIKNIGPLGGIHAALSVTSKEEIFFVACDMPFLHNGLIKRQGGEFMKTNADVFIPRIMGSIEPMHGFYKKRILEDLLLFLQSNRKHSIREFLQTVNTLYWELEDTATNRKYFTNINTLQELHKITIQS